jgi:hypothetical protein
MTRNPTTKVRVSGFVLGLLALLSACGGSQEPAESPEATPAAAPAQAPADVPGDGEHVMPDGTKMKGDHHGEHTMPDGTKMEGDEHKSHE